MNIVLITDCIDETNHAFTRRDYEGNTDEQNQRLIQSLSPLAEKLYHYTSVREFKKNIDFHQNDIIFPLQYGENSCNQKLFLPSICDEFHLSYIGADAQTHAVCNNKYLSKLYANTKFGIRTAESILISNLSELHKNTINYLNLPIIAKPNYGGGSVGITNHNIVDNYTDAIQLVKNILVNFHVPVLVEEYIPGYEVELILVGNQNKVTFCEEVQLMIHGKEKFDDEIWGLETKKFDDSHVNFKVSDLISDKDKYNMINLFKSFPKIEFARIDGRIKNGKFYLIEISPDCYLGDDCAFYYAFSQRGISHTEMFRFIIGNHLGEYCNPNILKNPL